MNKQKQSGFAHIMIVTVILGIGLVGALGFVYYQNFIQKKDVVVKTDDSSKTKDNATKAPVVSANDSVDANKGYLTLDDWDVKFKLPSDLGSTEITYYKGDGVLPESSSLVYSFSTKQVEALGGNCSGNTDSGPITYLASVTRQKSLRDSPNGQTPSLSQDGYYYYIDTAQSTCSEKGTDIQIQSLALVKKLLATIQKK